MTTFGSYDMVRVVAKGGMGAVFEVRSRHSGARAAAKTILNAKDAGGRERFRREAELLARCDRIPGIVKVHSFGEQPDGTLYMILDFVDGPSLDKLLETKDRFGPIEASRVVRDVARALGGVHAKGIVHRDVKPGNILVDSQGKPWLTDFGLAAARDLERLTRTGTFVGTVSYCSPEQAAGTPCGAPSDVFSLGCVLFHLLSGEPPIEAVSTIEHMARLASTGPIRDVREVEEKVPRPLASIVARALVKEPEGRYADGEALARDLDRFLGGESVEGLGAAAPRRLLAVLGVLAVAVVVLVIVAYRVRSAGLERALDEARTEAEHARHVVSRGGDLDEARRAVDTARVALARGRGAGAAAASAVGSEVAAASGEVGSALAQRAFARGAHAEALALVEGEAVVPFEGQLVRARSLIALGRRSDAASALVESVIEAQPRVRRADGFEVLGDACAGQDDERAERAYAAAEEAGKTSRELRLKRAGAAAAVGRDELALAALKALVSDVEKLAPEREKNAAFARLAPALYRSGLAAKDERLLEGAWRLAPPPLALESTLVEHWTRTADADATLWSENFLASLKGGEADVWRLRAILARAGRIRSAPLDLYRSGSGFASSLALVRGWARNADAEPLARVAVAFLADWPEHPFFLFLQAWNERRPGGAYPKALALMARAIDRLPPPRADEDLEVRRLASQCAYYYAEISERAKAVPDLARIRRATERGGYAEGWLWFARACIRARQFDEALVALDKAAPVTNSSNAFVRGAELEFERLQILILTEKRDEAAARAKELAASSESIVEGIRVLNQLERWDDILALVDPARTDEVDPLTYLAVALAVRGRFEEARRLIPRVEHRAPARADLIRAAIKKFEKG